jgi:hypothetical protein
MTEPKPKQPASEAEKTTEEEELSSDQLDDVSGGIIIIGGATALNRKIAPSVVDDPEDDPLAP